MTDSTAETKFGRWAAPRIPLSIEYSIEVTEDIRAAVCTGPEELEKGGVLFGIRQDRSVRISAWRPIHCEHSEGPALRLSSDDRRELLRLLLAAKHDPELAELQPLGWFVSHVSGDIALNHSDIGIANDFFSAPWQVTLVLAPGPAGAVRARFFPRDANGALLTDSSPADFVIQPLRRSKGRLSASWDRAAVLAKLPWAIAALLAVILIAVLTRPRNVEPVNPGFDLRISDLRIQDASPSFQIAWDANSAPIRAASGAEIRIQDGLQTSNVALNAAQLRQGEIHHGRKTSDVQVQMRVHEDRGEVVQEFARLSVHTISPPVPPPDPSEGEVKRLNLELHQERVISDRLKQTVKILENRIAVDSARAK